MPSHDYQRDQYESDRGDAEAKAARILADVKNWGCCGCGKPCAVNLDRPILGPFSECCMKPAYNRDDITNASDSVSETGRLRTMREIEQEDAA